MARQPHAIVSCCRTTYKLGFVLCVITWIHSTLTEAEVYIQESQDWFTARKRCQEREGDMFVLTSNIIYGNVTSKLKRRTFHWVGATEQSRWRWISDSTPLCRYIGHGSLPFHNKGRNITLPGNSVDACYRACSSYQYVGLSKTSCYCLEYKPANLGINDVIEKFCPGNFAEKCGSSSTMSVYKQDVAGLAIDLRGPEQCVYATKTYIVDHLSIKLATKDCSETLPSLCYEEGSWDSNYEIWKCSETVCSSWKYRSWKDSNRTCNLLRVTDTNKMDLFEVMHLGSKYWVGLYRYIDRNWINNTTIEYHLTLGEAYQRCFVLWRGYDSFSLHWRPCYEEHLSICVKDPDIRTSTESTEETTVGATTLTENAATWKPDSSERSSHTTLITTTLLQVDHIEDMDRMKDGDTLIGMYAGAGIGCLVIALTVILLFVLRRQGRLCFKKTNNGTSVHYSPTGEHVTHCLGVSARRRMVSGSSSSRDRESVENMVIESGIQNGYGNNRTERSTSVDMYSQVSRPSKKGRTGSKSNNYNDNCHSTIPDLVDKEDLNAVDHTDDEHVYNTTGQKSTPSETDKCYHHLGDTDSDYDVTGHQRQRNTFDDTYNHLTDVKSDTDYDVTGHQQQRNTFDDTYNHLTDEKHQGVHLENGDDPEQSRVQNNQDMPPQGNTGETTDYYNISRLSADDGGYYNVGFQLERQEQEPDREEEDHGDVYQLAKAMTDG